MHIDEKFIKVRGSKDSFAYLFITLGDDNKIRGIYLANARTKESAKELFRKLKQKKQTPEIAVTDGCQIIVHKEKLMKISNNRIERLNSDIDLFLHVFRGLKNFETANIWLQGFVVYHNYLKPSTIRWYRIPKMLASRRQISIKHIFYIELSPFNLTES